MSDYLLNRNGTFYYQRRIPTSILRKFPSISPVLRISLGTGRKSEAKTLSHKLSKMFDDFAKVYFKTPEEYTEAFMLLRKFKLVTCTSSLDTKDIDDFFEKNGKDSADKIGKANRVIEARESEVFLHAHIQSFKVQGVNVENNKIVLCM